MKSIVTALLVAFLAFSFPAHARSPVPLVELENQSISSGSGKPLTLDDVQHALQQAAPVRGWVIDEQGPGYAVATLNVRNKHTIRVDITYTEASISLKYKDSTNMKYGTDNDGKVVIHPYYMKWVDNLLTDLRVQLARF